MSEHARMKYLRKCSGVMWMLAMALVASPGMAADIVGGVPSFIATRARIEPAPDVDPTICGPFWVCQNVVGTGFAEAGTTSGAYAKVRADFGVNGAFASVSAAQTDREAYAESIWSDGFVVHGGSGSSTLSITVRVDGTLDGGGRPGGPGSNAFYGLFVSSSPITCDFDEIFCTGDHAIALTEPLAATSYLHASIAFTYDQPFYLASYLGAEVVGGATGVADFYHSAHIGLSTPEGASLTSASGTVYRPISAVPEPTSLLMSLTGALLIGGRVARHRLSGRRPGARG